MKVSVIMSIFNGEEYLYKSISSLLNQTYKNFELIIIDDASTDKTSDMLLDYSTKDKRIKILTNKYNLGLTKSLIKGVEFSSGDIIFRQDVDEISNINRIKILLEYYKDSSIVAVGSNCLNIFSNTLEINWGYFSENKIKKIIKYKTVFSHGSSSFRKSTYIKVSGYDSNFVTCQDFDLWNKLSKLGRIIMSDNVLLNRFIDKNSISKTRRFRQFYDSFRIRIKHRVHILDYKIYLFSINFLIQSFLPLKIYLYIKKIKNL